MVTQSDLVPSQRFLQEVIANRGQAAGLDGRVFRAKGIADCDRDCVSVLKLGVSRNCVSKKPCGSGGVRVETLFGFGEI